LEEKTSGSNAAGKGEKKVEITIEREKGKRGERKKEKGGENKKENR